MRALSRGPRVLALTSSPERVAPLRAVGVQPLLGNLDAPRTLARLAGLATHVLHLAPPPAAGERDVRTRALVQMLARRTPPRAVVYVSTSGVYGDCGGAWVPETRRIAPKTARALRRVDAEATLRRWGRRGVRVSLLRVGGIYALDRPGGGPHARLLSGLPLPDAADDPYVNHIHADDLARACVLALWRGDAQRACNVCDDSAMRMGEYFDLAADLLGLARLPRVEMARLEREASAGWMSFLAESRRLVNRRLRQELGLVLRFPTVREGLQAGGPVQRG